MTPIIIILGPTGAGRADTVRELAENAWPEGRKIRILREARETLATLQSESLREPDVADRASSETDWSIELRTRDRQRKLISKIDAALRRFGRGKSTVYALADEAAPIPVWRITETGERLLLGGEGGDPTQFAHH